jgi:dihydroorotase
MVIKNINVVDSQGRRIQDICIDDEKIVSINSCKNDEKGIDGSHLYVLPGLYDLNVSLKDGSLNANAMKKLSHQAYQGGVTHFVLKPTTTPPINDEISLEFVQSHHHMKEGATIDVAVNAMGKDGLSNIAILLKNGAVAPFIQTSYNTNQIRRTLEYAKMADVPVLCEVRDDALDSSGVMNEGTVSATLGLPGILTLSEEIHVAKMIEMARFFDVHVHFLALSSLRAFELVAKAKKEGVRVSSEVSIHHLLRDDSACEGYNVYAKLLPPLRDKNSRDKLVALLQDGSIDMITSLQSEQSQVSKEVAFSDASYGIDAIENYLAIIYTHLVQTEILSFEALIRLGVENPRKLLKHDAVVVEKGTKLDALLFFDPTLEVNDQTSLYANTPLKGKVVSIVGLKQA